MIYKLGFLCDKSLFNHNLPPLSDINAVAQVRGTKRTDNPLSLEVIDGIVGSLSRTYERQRLNSSIDAVECH